MVRGTYFVSVSIIHRLDLGTVLTVCYFYLFFMLLLTTCYELSQRRNFLKTKADIILEQQKRFSYCKKQRLSLNNSGRVSRIQCSTIISAFNINAERSQEHKVINISARRLTSTSRNFEKKVETVRVNNSTNIN